MNDKLLGQSFSSLPRSKKTAVILLSIVAVGILIVWFWQFNSRINNPFIVKPTEEDLKNNKVIQEGSSKIKDTDIDGLSDFDETNIYNTSPYIEDTDGDGILDGIEISKNSNPLCPEGENCSVSTTVVATSTPIKNNTGTPSTINSSNIDQQLLIQALSGAGNPDILRQLLLQSGGDKESLNKISDEDLMLSYKEVLQAQNPAVLENIKSAGDSATSTIK